MNQPATLTMPPDFLFAITELSESLSSIFSFKPSFLLAFFESATMLTYMPVKTSKSGHWWHTIMTWNYLFTKTLVQCPKNKHGNTWAVKDIQGNEGRLMEIQFAIVWCWAFTPHHIRRIGPIPITNRCRHTNFNSTCFSTLSRLVASNKVMDISTRTFFTSINGNSDLWCTRARTFGFQIRGTRRSTRAIYTIRLAFRAGGTNWFRATSNVSDTKRCASICVIGWEWTTGSIRVKAVN